MLGIWPSRYSGGGDVKQVYLGRVEVAHGPLPKRAVPRRMEVSIGVQRGNACGLPGRLDVGADTVYQAVAGALVVVRDDPGAECVELLRAGESPFAPRRGHGPANSR